jgi:hypothetical protein
MSDTIRLFVGVDGTNCDLESQAVAEYSARKHCSLPLSITWMQQAKKGPWSGWNCSTGRTPFTHFRWSIPAVCNYEGKAIYTDSDFIFLADLADLWRQPVPNVGLVRNATGKLSTSCILFDCAKAKKHVPSLDELRAMPDAHSVVLNYFRANPHLLAAFEGNWDCPDLKGYTLGDPDVKAVHYTRISSQLQLKHAIPRLRAEGRSHWYDGEIHEHPSRELQALFDQLLTEAAVAGYGIDRYLVKPFDGSERKNFVYSSENPRR